MFFSGILKRTNGFNSPNAAEELEEETLEFNKNFLQELARDSGGQCFNAKNREALKAIYGSIAKVEKSTIKVTEYESREEKLLSYSKVNSTLQTNETVDLNTVIEQIEEDLEVQIQAKKAAITTTELPKITGNNLLIYQLFYNLILNSLKFSNADEPGRINISSSMIEEDNRQFYKISLSDKGIGFDSDHVDISYATNRRT